MQARGAETGSSEVELPLPDYDGPEVEIAFDPEYLVEFLRALEGEPTRDAGDDAAATKPALFKCGDELPVPGDAAGGVTVASAGRDDGTDRTMARRPSGTATKARRRSPTSSAGCSRPAGGAGRTTGCGSKRRGPTPPARSC